MDLSTIISIAGKPGLFKVLGQTSGGLIIESMLDGKRSAAFATDQVSTLEDISIYTADDDVPLRDVFKMIHDKEEGKKSIDHKSDNDKLKAYFKEVFPEHDEDRVYTSDIKKVIRWYNVMVEAGELNFDEKEEDDKEEKKDEKEAKKDDKKKAVAKKAANKPKGTRAPQPKGSSKAKSAGPKLPVKK